MTFGRQGRRGGVEADTSFYVARVPEVAGRLVDPATDPPPNLVIEAVHTHPVGKSHRTNLRPEVPEVWVYRRRKDRILAFRGGRYVEVDRSLAFPFLAVEEVRDWVDRPITTDLQWRRPLRDWNRAVLASRRGEG